MAIITDTHETNTYTPESGVKSLETYAEEQKGVEAHLTVVADLHNSRLDAESFDTSALRSYEKSVAELGADADKSNLDALSLMTSGALVDQDTAEALFRSAEQDEDGLLRSAWARSLDIRTHATSAQEEAHALDSMLEASYNDNRADKATRRRISALAAGLLSQYPDKVAKYAGYLVDTSVH